MNSKTMNINKKNARMIEKSKQWKQMFFIRIFKCSLNGSDLYEILIK
jgi:hypothetical protein